MKRFTVLPLVVLLLAGGWSLAPAQTSTFSSIPSYYSELQWNLTSPGGFSTPAGGYANPAVFGTLRGFESQFSWTDQGNSFGSMGSWGLFLGGSKLGFGVIRNEIPLPGGQVAGVNDMRIALSGGDRRTGVGLGFGWSSGDDDLVGRSRIFQVGTVHRYDRYVSIGLSGNFALDNSNQSGLFDVAVRPLGDRRVTVFADAEWPKHLSLSDAPWSLGAMLEPLPGLRITGRYFEDESYSFGIGLVMGGLSLYGTPRFDKDNNTTNTTYHIRSGFPEQGYIEDSFNKGHYYLSMNLKGTVKYRGFKYFDKYSHPLYRVLTDLEKAKADPAISGVYLSLSGMQISRGKAWEIREKLRELQAAGKHVVVYVDEMGMTEYHLASVADRIVMDPEGLILIPGYVLGRTFVKDMLTKIGVGFDEWRFFKYKSAAESFSRDKMSDPDREQRYALVEDFYATTRQDVTGSRRVSADTFDDWVNKEVLISPKQALELGLVDKLGRREDVKKAIEELEGSKKPYWSRDMLAGNRYPSTLWGSDPEIAVVYALGECAMDSGIKARKLEKLIGKLKDHRPTRAVVFRVDSPGGSALASDLVAEQLRECAKKKPVIITQGDVAASGGYWLSMYGDEIYALPGTITGSIGVIGGWIWNDGIGEKLGHTSDHVKVGDKADIGYGIRLLLAGPMLPDRNLTGEERDEIEKEMKDFYRGFLEKVGSGREMAVDEVEKVAQGRVFSGTDGIDAGLIDKIGGLDHAIRAAREAAGIPEGERVTVVEYPKLPAFNLAGFRRYPVLSRWFGAQDDSRPEEAVQFFDNPEWTYIRTLINHPGRPLVMLPPEYYVHDARWGKGGVSE